MVKTFDILLDLEKELYSPSSLLFSVSRNDFNTIQLNLIITQDGTPFNLTNKIVELAVKKPSGLTVYQDCEITGAPEGKAQLELNQQAYIEYGIYTAEVYVREGTDIAVTSPFWYQAKSSIFNEDTEEAIESIADWSALQKALFAYDLKPILVENFPTITPEYVGQMAFDTVNEIAYIATDLSSVDWQTFGGGGGGNDTIFGDNPLNFIPARIGQIFIDEINEDAYIAIGATANDWQQINNEDFVKQAITWGEILEKPTTFAPEPHAHEIIDILGLQNTLDLKADDIDLTTKANIADVYTKLETYSKTEVEGLVTGATEGIETIVEDNLTSINIDTALSANQGRILNETKADINHVHDYAPETHNHLVAEIEGLQTELDGKANLIHTHVKADITDFAHTHSMNDVEGLNSAVEDKAKKPPTRATADIPNSSAEFVGQYVIDTDLNNAFISFYNNAWEQLAFISDLDEKADLIHTHDFDSITNKPVAYPSIAHFHEITDVVGLQNALDAKVNVIPPNDLILNVTSLTNAVQLDWEVGTATSWTIWRSEISGKLGEKLVSDLITNTYVDSTALGGTTYYYTLQVEDTSQKTISDQVEATPYSITVYGSKRVEFAGYAGWTVYTTTEATADFGNEFTVQGGDRLKIDTSERLRFELPIGMVGSSDTGGIIKAKIAGKTDYTIEYGIRFDSGFPWSKGGKVPGFSGGAGYTGGAPAWDGDGFSVRLMWREGGRIIPYVYHYNQPDEFGDTFGETLGYFTDTQEHIIKYYAVLNTGSNADGILKIYLDGVQVFDKRDLVYRTDESLIDTAHIAIFAGGSGADWNMTATGNIRLGYFDWR
jgi:hypothetical protein